ncbi:hypothetical protein C8J57DRAFT_1237141 [Mycena rebaudengoi]|nr:hypothetical protein C8J57DRAFT_1237141 [Mycena rebaudengoi]
MKFAAALFALVPFVAALPPAVRTVEPEIRNATALVLNLLLDPIPIPFLTRPRQVSLTPNTQGNIFVGVNDHWKGGTATFHGSSGQCVNVPVIWNELISAFGRDPGQDCFIFIDAGCSGPQNGPIRSPGIPNLATIGFNDAVSSFKFVYIH